MDYVVLDSNVWISELGLKSALGSAMRFYIKRNGATLVVPEVVRLESERHLRSELTKHVEGIGKSHSKLLSVFGRLKEVVLPTEEDIEEVVAGLFRDIGITFEEISFSLESARDSFIRTIDKVAPSATREQFKDGVLWADCVELAAKGNVHLVSRDKAFYEGGDYVQGLSKDLRLETNDIGHEISLYYKLHDLLEVMQTEVAISGEDLLEEFLRTHRESVDSTLGRVGFTIVRVTKELISTFATENPSELYVEFELLVECEPTIEDGRRDGELMIRGDGRLLLDEGKYDELRNFGEEFSYTNADGNPETTKNTVLMVGSAVIGHREVQYSVRHKLD